MDFLKKSILNKFIALFVLTGALLFIFGYYLLIQKGAISPSLFLVGFVILLLISCWFIIFSVLRPLRLVLKPMMQLMAGKQYQKVYTKRIDEIGILANFFNEVTKAFTRIDTDIKEERRMLKELEIASNIQRDILPPQNPKVKYLDITAKTKPAVELGGDNFDFVTVKDNTYIYIGDATGHGVPAAIVMTMANTLIHTFTEFFDSAYDVVVQTNKQLKARIRSTMFMTMLMYRWNEKDQKMYYVGCGHEHVLVFRASTGKCDVIPSGGIALGMVPDNSKLISEKELKLEVGDVVVLYTDGITEGKTLSGEMYGLSRLVQAVELYASKYGSDGIVNHVAQDYSRFTQEHVQDDDVTLIAIKYVGDNPVTVVNNSFITTTAWSDTELKAPTVNDTEF